MKQNEVDQFITVNDLIMIINEYNLIQKIYHNLFRKVFLDMIVEMEGSIDQNQEEKPQSSTLENVDAKSEVRDEKLSESKEETQHQL